MGWEPPTEDEFNSDWYRVPEVLNLLPHIQSLYNRKMWLMDNLREGLITAVARNGPDRKGGPVKPFVPVLPGLWNKWDDEGPAYFWETGTAVFITYGDGYGGGQINSRYFDVRFDPKTFNGKIPANRPEGAHEGDDPVRSAAPAGPSTTPSLPSISPANLEKVARLVADLWGTSLTELEALKMAQACFPNHKVSKHRFLEQYRCVRPAKRPGKQRSNH